MISIDVYWSFRSPFSYLITPDLLKLKEDYPVELVLRPVLPLALREPDSLFAEKNRNKAHYIVVDAFRRAQFLGMSMVWPSPDPVVQDLTNFSIAKDQPYIYRLTALGIEAQRRGKGIELAHAISHLLFAGTPDWDKGDHLHNAVASAGLDLAAMEQHLADYDAMAEVEHHHAMLEAAGHWGVPTLVLNGEPFFGQDRVDTLRWRLDLLLTSAG